MLRVAKIIPRTTVEGPHERCAIWVAGCDLACPGCCNPELFDPGAGEVTPIEPLLDAARDAEVEGITVLGGEPLQQIEAVAALLDRAQVQGLGTILFSGYTLAHARSLPGFSRVWASLDTLVDGPFDVRRPERVRRFIGSANQGLHHRTERYAEPSLWRGPNRVEVRIDANGSIELHGMPRPVARFARSLK